MEILSIALSFVGLLALILGFIQARELRNHLKTGKVKEAWDKLSFLIAIFIVGYIGYILNLMFADIKFNTDVLISSIFFLGALFVLLAAHYNKNAFQH